MESERRLHPLSFLFVIAHTARGILFPAILAAFAARSRDNWEVGAVLVLVPLAAVAFGRTLSFRYRFDEGELVIRHGFVFRRVRHIPYERIQNINVIQGPVHRLLGVIEVRIETGGGAELDGHLRVVDRTALDEIRARVEVRGQVNPVAAMEAAEGRTLLRLPPREVLLLGLVQGRGMVIVGAIFGLLYEVGFFDRAIGPDGSAGRGIIRRITEAAFADGRWPIQQALIALAATIMVLGIFRVLSALWTAVRFYGFTLQQSGSDLRCEYGLLTRVTWSIPIARIQKLTVYDGPWHRFGGRVSLHVQSAGGVAGKEAETGRRWLAPLVKTERLAAILEQVLPDAARAVDWRGVHPKAVRRLFAKHLLFVVPLIAAGVAFLGWAFVAAVPLAVIFAWVNSRRTAAALRWGLTGDAVHFTSGWIWRTRVVAPITKVQAVARGETPFDRRHAMASVVADTAGGQGPRQNAIRIPYLPRDVADDLASYLAAAAARTEFRW